jgi:DNA-binding NtrC family response regulator
MSNQPMILVAEPEEVVRESIQITLIEEGYDCHAVCDTVSLLRAIRIHNSNLIIADVRIIYDKIHEILDTQNHYSTVPPFLVVLSYEQVGTMPNLMKLGITEYLIKPFSFEELLERIQKTIIPKPNTPI